MQNGGKSTKSRKSERSPEGQHRRNCSIKASEKKSGKRLPYDFRDARSAALCLLDTMEKKRFTLDASLELFSDRFTLSPRDQSLFHAVVHGVLRWKGALDSIIEHFSSRSLDRIDPSVLNILRIALFQVRYMDKIPVSAAVNTAVNLTRQMAQPWATGYVNALLRAAVTVSWESLWPDPKQDPVEWLSKSRSYPVWLVSRWMNRIGFSRARALCDIQNEIPPITIRVNRLKTTRDKLLQDLKDVCEAIRPTRFSPEGISFSNPRVPVSEMPPFKAGGFQVQDEAAQLVTVLLDPRPGETILDACAGLGGKTGHIAQRMQNEGHLVAWDIHLKKLQRLTAEMHRLGVTQVHSERKNLDAPVEKDLGIRFHRVLLDAPCSGLGVLRRNPDARWRITSSDLNRYREIQIRMLNHAAALVKPSGILVYAVCSTEPEENESVVDAFLETHSDFELRRDESEIPDPLRFLMKETPFLKTSPLDHGMDGFFAARLEKKS